MLWVFVLYMNGWPVEVDTFATRAQCEDKVRIYRAALTQATSSARVWCEERPRA